MPSGIDNIRFLTGNREMLEGAAATPALPTWSARTLEFFSAFSRSLLGDRRTRAFEDVTAYAFWIRRASLCHIREVYYPHTGDRVGRGVAFHIAPSNVPINFAVSFTSSLLAGNVCIVRLSNKPFEQVSIVVDSLRATFDGGFQDMEKYLLLVRYDHDAEITQYLSSLCDVRVIWGGNRTIETVRRAALPPRTIEMAFADRHSLALLNADAVVAADVEALARQFYTDTYYIDQNACSSPRMVVWFGNQVRRARALFWSAVEKLVREKYAFQDIQAVDKLDQFCLLAAGHENVRLADGDNRVMRIEVSELDATLMDYKLGGGYFFEYAARDLSELLPVLGKACQTVSYFGLDGHEIQDFVLRHGVRGCDRVVPVGRTMDLTFKWDGYDMIETMSRIVYCPDYLK